MELKLHKKCTSCNKTILLIVPYGIETSAFLQPLLYAYPAFNRTLWN